jgi:phosphoglycerate dehydrogenase-like enzyme
MVKGLYLCSADVLDRVYGPQEQAAIARLADIYAPPQTSQSIAQNPGILRDAEILFGSWGVPKLTAEFLAQAPELKVLFYGAGSIRGFATEAFWKRGVLVTSAYAANAVPVSEYVLSQILFCLKHGWQSALDLKKRGGYARPDTAPGAYRSTVGLVSLGMIGRLVRERLRPFDLKVIAYDPFLTQETARQLDVELCPLEEVFQRADVVSLHTPWLKETEGLITGALIDSMKPHSTFINTARGAVVREAEMLEVLARRQDLFAVLDVTWPEPPALDSPIYTLPNVVLTPHIAGSMGLECRRMGNLMVEELRRYLAGESLLYSLTEAKARTMA